MLGQPELVEKNANVRTLLEQLPEEVQSERLN
jgi:hypothetical protein